ncbi:MAG: zinc ribbon domain-containing protein [Nitrososphaerota archaeon]
MRRRTLKTPPRSRLTTSAPLSVKSPKHILANSIYVTGMEGVDRAVKVEMSLRRSYANGFKYCTRCRTYYKIEGYRCPYCGTALRSSPRKKKYSEKEKKYVRLEKSV